MTLTEPQRRALATRDLSVDLVRVCCVLAVVVLHSLMVGIALRPDGSIGWRNVVQEQPWFPVASWFGQLMPLFFVLGGFAGWQGWASTRRKGGTAGDFVRARLLRLASPLAVWYLALGALLLGAVLVGLPVGVAQLLAGGVGMPLWFLAAYLVSQAVLPLLVEAYRRRPVTLGLALLGCCVAVDAGRFATGVPQVGLLNLAFVWPLVQCLGFLHADGRLARLPRPVLLLVAAGAFTVVGLLGELGPYSADMLDDLNPPTTPLVFVGIGQTALFVLVKPMLDALMRRRAAQAFVAVGGTRLMTVYLWHLLVVILVAAAVLVVPGLPAVGTPAWWWARIPGDLLVFAVLLVIAAAVARFERGPRRLGARPSPGVLAVALVLAVVPPFWAMELRLDLFGLVWGAVAVGTAVLLARGRPGPRPTAAPSTAAAVSGTTGNRER